MNSLTRRSDPVPQEPRRGGKQGRSDSRRLTASGLTAGYRKGNPVIHDINLTVEPGALVALIGPNGSGKSTLLKTVCRLTSVESGDLVLGERDLLGVGSHHLSRLGLSYVPQHQGVFTALTVQENLEVGGVVLPRKQAAARVDAVMDLLPLLKDRRAAHAGALSGGEQRLVSIGRALVPDPDLLLMDEPTAGLSPKAAENILAHVSHLHESTAVSLLLVEQNALAAVAIADYVHVMSAGSVAFSGTAQEMQDHSELADLYLGG